MVARIKQQVAILPVWSKPDMIDEADSTDRRILAIATEHLRKFGVKRMTVVAIAEQAGMTHANVYRYFPSKQALADRVAGDWLRGPETRLSEIVQAPDPADDKLERFITSLSRAYEEKLARDPHIFAVFVDALEEKRSVTSRHLSRVRELIGRVIEEGIATRVLVAADPGRIEILIFDALHRFLHPQAVFIAKKYEDAKQSGALDSRRDRITRLVVRGLVSGRVK